MTNLETFLLVMLALVIAAWAIQAGEYRKRIRDLLAVPDIERQMRHQAWVEALLAKRELGKAQRRIHRQRKANATLVARVAYLQGLVQGQRERLAYLALAPEQRAYVDQQSALRAGAKEPPGQEAPPT